MRKVVSSLHVGVSYIQKLSKKNFPHAKLSIEGRLRKLTNRMKMSCERNLTRIGISSTREAVKQLQEEFEVEVSEEIVCHRLHRQG